MLKIALTGGIGSGKSIIAKMFAALGIPVFDADATAKNIMNTDAELKEKIKATFGKDAYVNEILDRKYLANIVFNDHFKLEQLNSLVHPATILAAQKWFEQQTAAPYAVKEAALIFESGTAGDADYVIGVYAPINIRIARVKKRDNASADEIKQRIEHQLDENIKMKLCDFVIYNDEQQALIPQVIQLHQFFLEKANKMG